MEETWIKENFYYERDTGALRWKTNVSRRRAGSAVGYKHFSGRLRFRRGTRLMEVHLIVWILMNGQPPEGYYPIHKDGDGTNNRLDNLVLTETSRLPFKARLRSNNVSGIKGVHWSKEKQLWRAQIGFQGNVRFLGYFSSKERAKVAYEEAVEQTVKESLGSGQARAEGV